MNNLWIVDSSFKGVKPESRTGHSVSISRNGNTILIGENTFSTDKKEKCGRVRIFENSKETLNIKGMTNFSFVGHSVSVSDDSKVIAFSEPFYAKERGRVLIFSKEQEKWIKKNEILGFTEGQRFGWDISLNWDGSIISIVSECERNQVTVFKEVNKVYTSLGLIDLHEYSAISSSLSSCGKILAILEKRIFFEDDDIISVDDDYHVKTRVQILIYSEEEDVWNQIGSDIPSETVEFETGENKVKISGDGSTIIIGESSFDKNRGKVRCFRFDRFKSVWSQLGQTIEGEVNHNQMGCSIAISFNGKTIAIGEQSYLDEENKTIGCVRIFDLNGKKGNWKPSQPIYGEYDNDNLGHSIDISPEGDLVIVGEPRFGVFTPDGEKVETGRARVFKRYTPPTTSYSSLGSKKSESRRKSVHSISAILVDGVLHTPKENGEVFIKNDGIIQVITNEKTSCSIIPKCVKRVQKGKYVITPSSITKKMGVKTVDYKIKNQETVQTTSTIINREVDNTKFDLAVRVSVVLVVITFFSLFFVSRRN